MEGRGDAVKVALDGVERGVGEVVRVGEWVASEAVGHSVGERGEEGEVRGEGEEDKEARGEEEKEGEGVGVPVVSQEYSGEVVTK